MKDRKKWMPPLIGILVISILGLEILFITKDFFPTKITACTDPQETYETYDVFSAEGPMTRFRNRVDGYSIAVPRGMKADMSRGDLCAVLTDETTRMEIYRQPTPTPKEQESYIYYSNGFMDNKIDHKVSVNELREFGKNNALVTAWERKPVSAIPKDYNHYLSFDILMKENTFSVLIKSTEPIDPSYYAPMIAGFKAEKPTKTYHPPRTRAVNMETRGWNEETEAFYRRYFSDDAETVFGLFEPEFCAFRYENYERIEKRLDYDFPVMVMYNHIEKEEDLDNLKAILTESYRRGKILELTLQTTDAQPGEGNTVYAILRGEYDDRLREYAEIVSEFDHPVLFRLGNEMNGDWCAYSGYQTGKDTLVFREFYRYIYRIFEEAGADNVIWVWNPNGESKPPFRWNDALAYYPGDEYVDVIGLTAYNTGTYYNDVGEKWSTFKELYKDLYANYGKLFGQPMMITEFSCSAMGGDKAAWITDMFEEIKNYPDIKLAIWWDGCDYDQDGNIARSYFIDDSEEVLDAFYQGLHPLENGDSSYKK